MRRRTRDKATFLFVLAFGFTTVAMTATNWVRPRWLGLAIAAIGWTVYALFILGQMLVMWNLFRRPVASRPWILGGPPDASPTKESAKRDA